MVPFSGPSPRVWGLLDGFPLVLQGLRSIPTRVGTTSPGPAINLHPRSIPTRVGTTPPPRHGPPLEAVHPHACGDYEVGPGDFIRPDRSIPTRVGTTAWAWAAVSAAFGPSPRVWGLRLHARRFARPYRSIPTRVGTTARSTPPQPQLAVHPHACGDYSRLAQGRCNLRGPSPRVWGLRNLMRAGSLSSRSIPTRVGTTSVNEPGGLAFAVHPHACGDYSVSSRPTGHLNGPSPRVWGLHLTRTAKTPIDPPLCVLKGAIPRFTCQAPRASP